MTGILKNALIIADRIRNMELTGMVPMLLFGVLLIFGIINCILGYRLIRFWMMIFGFFIGAGAALVGFYEVGITNKTYCMAGMLAVGVVVAVLAFAVFKAGVFLLGAGLGMTGAIYLIHPTTSFTFFLCILIGVGIGVLALRFEREVLVVGTSILGGTLAGCAAVKFLTAEYPQLSTAFLAVLCSIVFALLGILIQFAINKPKYEKVPEEREETKEEIEVTLEKYGVDEDEVIEEYLEDYYGEKKREKKSEEKKNKHKNTPGSM